MVRMGQVADNRIRAKEQQKQEGGDIHSSSLPYQFFITRNMLILVSIALGYRNGGNSVRGLGRGEKEAIAKDWEELSGERLWAL